MTYPIILAHGIARFDFVWKHDNCDEICDSYHYWKKIRTILLEKNYKVYHTDVNWAGLVAVRAEQMAQQIKDYVQRNHLEKVNIIAHSMGGLDARYAIVKYDLAKYVASLTTLGTPHNGSCFADWCMQSGIINSVAPILSAIGVSISGVADLTINSCKKRNEELQEFEEKNQHNILYQTYAGSQGIFDIFWPLLHSYRIIKKYQGANDGLVPVSSAMWKDKYYKETVNLDHLNLLGWWDPAELEMSDYISPSKIKEKEEKFYEDIKTFYLSIAKKLP